MNGIVKPVPERSALHLNTPCGAMQLQASARGLFALRFAHEFDEVRTAQAGAPGWSWLQQGAQELEEYFAGQRQTFSTPLDLHGTPFQQEVWRRVAAIPFGAHAAYGVIAEEIGRPKAARAVGAANGDNPLPLFIPCHRVLGANGALTGFRGGLPNKRWLLTHEAQQCGQISLL